MYYKMAKLNNLTFALPLTFSFGVVRILKIYSLGYFRIYNTLLFFGVTMMYYRSLELIPAVKLKFCVL
jgi:hypothetical protein